MSIPGKRTVYTRVRCFGFQVLRIKNSAYSFPHTLFYQLSFSLSINVRSINVRAITRKQFFVVFSSPLVYIINLRLPRFVFFALSPAQFVAFRAIFARRLFSIKPVHFLSPFWTEYPSIQDAFLLSTQDRTNSKLQQSGDPHLSSRPCISQNVS